MCTGLASSERQVANELRAAGVHRLGDRQRALLLIRDLRSLTGPVQWQPEPEPTSTHQPSGGQILRCDVSTPAGLDAALAAVANAVPVILVNAALLRDAAAWSNLETLEAEFGSHPCTVLSNPRGEFTIYRRGIQHAGYDVTSDVVPRRMCFDAFARTLRRQESGRHAEVLYLQEHVAQRVFDEASAAEERGRGAQRSAGALLPSPVLAPHSRLRDSLRRFEASADSPSELLAQMRRAARLGAWSLSTLWVSPPAACSRCHFDMHDNILLQLTGRKRLLLLPPSEAPRLYLHPLSHPLDMRPRPRLERRTRARGTDAEAVEAAPLAEDGGFAAGVGPAADASSAAFPRLAHAWTLEGILGANEALFLPRCWFHEIESLGDGGEIEGLGDGGAIDGLGDGGGLGCELGGEVGGELARGEGGLAACSISLSAWFDYSNDAERSHRPCSARGPSAACTSSRALAADHGRGALLLAREVERALATSLGAAAVPSFIGACMRELQSEIAGPERAADSNLDFECATGDCGDAATQQGTPVPLAPRTGAESAGAARKAPGTASVRGGEAEPIEWRWVRAALVEGLAAVLPGGRRDVCPFIAAWFSPERFEGLSPKPNRSR